MTAKKKFAQKRLTLLQLTEKIKNASQACRRHDLFLGESGLLHRSKPPCLKLVSFDGKHPHPNGPNFGENVSNSVQLWIYKLRNGG